MPAGMTLEQMLRVMGGVPEPAPPLLLQQEVELRPVNRSRVKSDKAET